MTSLPIPVVQFPPGPTKAMLTLLPRLRCMRGIRPWRPHAFLRVLQGGRFSPDGEVTARSLVHLLLEKQPYLRSAWESAFLETGGCLCLLRRPSEEEFRRVWRMGGRSIDKPYGFRWEVMTATRDNKDRVGSMHVRSALAWAEVRAERGDEL